jgi:hypothetical protein
MVRKSKTYRTQQRHGGKKKLLIGLMPVASVAIINHQSTIISNLILGSRKLLRINHLECQDGYSRKPGFGLQ